MLLITATFVLGDGIVTRGLGGPGGRTDFGFGKAVAVTFSCGAGGTGGRVLPSDVAVGTPAPSGLGGPGGRLIPAVGRSLKPPCRAAFAVHREMVAVGISRRLLAYLAPLVRVFYALVLDNP